MLSHQFKEQRHLTEKDKFKKKIENINLLEKTVDWAIKIGTIGAGIFAVIQLSSQLTMQKKDQNMQLFLKQYEDDENIGEIRSNLYSDFDSSNAHNILTKEKEYVKEEYKKFIAETFTKDRTQDLLILANYYSGIASCVESGLCDQKTAKVLFKTEGKAFFGNYYPFFCRLNDRWKDGIVSSETINFYDLRYKPNEDETKKESFSLNWLFPQKKDYYEGVCENQND